MSESCKHGMPLSHGCDDCTIIELADRVRVLTDERDSARHALNFLLRCVAAEGIIDHIVN